MLVGLIAFSWLLEVSKPRGLLDCLHQVLEVDGILQLLSFKVIEWSLVGLGSILQLAQLRVVTRWLVSGLVRHLLAE